MIKRVLLIGGYGNFGRFIATSLASEATIQLIIAGRSQSKAEKLVNALHAANPAIAASLDVAKPIDACLAKLAPDIVIHTSGPFQHQSYAVAEACINHGCHYLDLADARDFVTNIGQLNTQAKNAGVFVVSGASSVPALTSAVIDQYIDHFKRLDAVDYGITTAQKTTRGLATTAAILSYTGKPFYTQINGKEQAIYGWQDIHRHTFRSLGKRYLSNCDIPDLSLFPSRYPSLKTIRFYAGLEIPLIHITLWSLSWLVRIGLISNLAKVAPLLLRLSFLFDNFGTANSGFHMKLVGTSDDETEKTVTFELCAKDGDGPYIPCMPAILLAKKLAAGNIEKTGATPCLDLITLDEYLDALKPLSISWGVNGT